MNKTIHQLDEIERLATNDEIPIWDNSASETKKVPTSEIKSLVIIATSTTVTGAKLMSGSVVKILFTSAITGSDTTTGLSISYNGTSYAIKVGKNGSLASFVASNISGTYTYLQAYTTLELAFDGTQFIVIGNPVVISNSDYTIYADGSITYTSIKSIEEDSVTIQFGTNDGTCYPLFSLPANTYVQGYIYANLGTTRLVDTLVIKDVQDGRVDMNFGGISIKQTYDYEYALLPFCYKSGNSAVTIYAEIYGTSGSISFKVRKAIFN